MGSPVRYAVTTRSHLREIRHFLPMHRASARVKRQLAHTPGCLRFASVVAGPREFWSLSLWRSRQEMQDFMRPGAHETFMWNFSGWFDSFWLMRWVPTPDERGDWEGLALLRPGDEQPPPAAGEHLEQAFQAIPELLEASRATGAPAFEASRVARRARRPVEGAVALTVRVAVPRPLRLAGTLGDLRGLRARLLGHPSVLRCVVGLDGPGQAYGLALCAEPGAWELLGAAPELERLERRGPVWAMRWEAVGEFGHWDGLRVRRLRRRGADSTTLRPIRFDEEG